MKIEQDLPFDVCENCTDFILRVREEMNVFNGDSIWTLKVRCKNENKCRLLRQNLKRMEGRSNG